MASRPKSLTTRWVPSVRRSALATRSARKPSGQLPSVGILDDPLPDQPPDDLRWRHIAARANLLENLLLARIDEDRQPGGSIFHGSTMLIRLSLNTSTSI